MLWAEIPPACIGRTVAFALAAIIAKMSVDNANNDVCFMGVLSRIIHWYAKIISYFLDI